MKVNWEPIKNWFGFTRRERRSTFIMLMLVVMIIGLRYSIPESKVAIEDIIVSGSDAYIQLSGSSGLMNGGLVSSYPDTMKKFRQRPAIKKSLPEKSTIDINSSDSATLVSLPGIGPVLSVRIIKYRRLLGGFASIDQLKEVYGLPLETFEIIKERVFADSTLITSININSAGYKELSRFPYFENFEVTAILKYRELKGRIKGLNDLIENKLITIEKASKVRPYLNFGE